eukprot:INCI19077.2.p1 GENE.INCI19077.2~~INCI19077.2.p1  ORF type:complete len:1066 (-),score=136.50 INCI19077.2:3080-6277(-)
MPSFFDDSDDDAVVQVREAKHSRRGHGAKSKNSGDVAVGDDAGIITIGQSRVLAPTLPELLRKQASAHPHRVFLKLWSSEGLPTVSLTFREFYAEAKAAAKILHSNGIQRAARIAFYGENSLEYLKFSFGCMLLGAIPVNLNWRQPASVLAGCFSLANCSFLLCSEHYRKDGLFVAKENECESKVLFLEYLGRADASALPEPPPAHNDSTDDMAVIFFTSGSTKTPKGVPHTHGELLWLCENYLQVLDNGSVPEDAGSLCLFPFFHVMGFVHNMLYNLYAGMFAVIHRETATAKITADLMLRACDELRPTYINTVPWIVEAFCSKLEKGDDDVKALACVEYFSYGGAALPDYCVPILERHGLSVMMSYGQTELAAAIMFTRRGGSLLGMRVFPGVEYELIDDQGDPCEPGNRQGELVLYNNHSSTLAYLPGSNARALAPPNMDTHQCYYTSDVFKEIPCPLDGEPLLVYCCRNDDLIVHKTGEMTHPIPSEQKILMECSDILKNVCMFGQGRSASLLAVELEKGTDLTPEIGHRLWDAIEKANQLQPSYSAISHQAVLIMDPSKGHPTLPTTAKGNVQRNRVEKIFAAELKEGEGTCDPELATLLIDCLSSDTLNALEEEEWDSLSLTSSRNGTSDPFLLKQFHAYFFALFGIVFIHLSNIGAASQYAPFLSAASVSPVWLAGLPRGFQLFALPVFLILMGIGDLPKFGGPNAGEKLSFSDFRKQVGLPFVLYLVCKYVLPVVAGAFLHPGYAIGGGHKTFPWVFLFMTYVRLLSFLAAKFRLPPIARAFFEHCAAFCVFRTRVLPKSILAHEPNSWAASSCTELPSAVSLSSILLGRTSCHNESSCRIEYAQPPASQGDGGRGASRNVSLGHCGVQLGHIHDGQLSVWVHSEQGARLSPVKVDFRCIRTRRHAPCIGRRGSVLHYDRGPQPPHADIGLRTTVFHLPAGSSVCHILPGGSVPRVVQGRAQVASASRCCTSGGGACIDICRSGCVLIANRVRCDHEAHPSELELHDHHVCVSSAPPLQKLCRSNCDIWTRSRRSSRSSRQWNGPSNRIPAPSNCWR